MVRSESYLLTAFIFTQDSVCCYENCSNRFLSVDSLFYPCAEIEGLGLCLRRVGYLFVTRNLVSNIYDCRHRFVSNRHHREMGNMLQINRSNSARTIDGFIAYGFVALRDELVLGSTFLCSTTMIWWKAYATGREPDVAPRFRSSL
ncbi:hypothetical protein BC938DRAFT_474046 [Jimgerdemannia flammicorona]|uniref:Uncharacterized protein n=1 Tax=Jimgerdemannia flammicorona TaxID=994334 RepID=A0A433Q306_9FUNG|nr:hypothetical protein BC938DRAFT_474046 [Jimgerdemannia flammicorona]